MDSTSKIRRSLCAFGLAAAAALPVFSVQAQSGPIKFGVTYPLTGAFAGFAKEQILGMEMAVADINAKGGVKGRQIQLVYEDTRGTPEGGVAAFRKVTEIDKVPVVLSIFTNVVTAQLPLADQLKIPMISGVEAPGLSARAQYAFAHSNRSARALNMLSQHLKSLGVKKAFTFMPDNAFGEDISKSAQEAVGAAGAQYAEARFRLGQPEYRGIVARAKEFNPDVILIATQGTADDGNVVKQLREIGVNAPIFISANLFDVKAWRDSVGTYVEGMTMVGPNVDVTDPKGKDFSTRFKAKHGRNPNYLQGTLYDMVAMYAAAIEKVGTDGTAIRDYLVGLKDFPSAMGGRFGMGPDRQTVMAINLWRVKGGELMKILPGQK